VSGPNTFTPALAPLSGGKQANLLLGGRAADTVKVHRLMAVTMNTKAGQRWGTNENGWSIQGKGNTMQRKQIYDQNVGFCKHVRFTFTFMSGCTFKPVGKMPGCSRSIAKPAPVFDRIFGQGPYIE